MPEDARNTQNLVAVDEIRDNTAMLANGAMCQIILVGGINFALKSEAEQNAIALSYQDFLNSLDFSVQIIIHSRKLNIDKYLETLDARRQKESSPLLQYQISEYQEFIKSFVKNNAIMRKIFLVVVPYFPVSLVPAGASGMMPWSKHTPEEQKADAAQKEADFQKNLAALKQRTAEVEEGLKVVGLETHILNDEELVELYYNFYNPESVEKEKVQIPE